MIKARQNSSFCVKTGGERGTRKCARKQLDSNCFLETLVCATAPIHRAHAAHGNQCIDAPRAEPLPDHRGRIRGARRRLLDHFIDPSRLRKRHISQAIRSKQRQHFVTQLRVATTGAINERGALIHVGNGERCIEQLADLRPCCRIKGHALTHHEMLFVFMWFKAQDLTIGSRRNS